MTTFFEPNFKRLRFSNLDTLSGVLDKCLRFSLIKKEFVSIFNNQATLGSFPILCYIYFPIKIVLIKNSYLCVCLFWILSNKLDLNQETRFTILMTNNCL